MAATYISAAAVRRRPVWSQKKLKSSYLSQSPRSSQRKEKILCVLSGLCEIF